MAYKRRKKIYKKRKPVRRNRRDTVSTVNKTNPFPQKFVTKLRYQERYVLDPPLAGLATQVMRANSVFDPDYTGIGHQPRYFDELMSSYDHYVVLGSKITVIANNSQGEAMNFAIQRTDDGAVSTTWNDVVENRNCVFTTINASNAGGNTKKLSLTYSPKKALGRSPWDPNLRGDAASNPSEGFYFNVIIGAFNEANNPGPTVISVIMDYTVAFSEPKRVTQS